MTKHDLVPVFTGLLQNEPTLLCNARDLHAFLAVGRDFATWIKDRIAEYGFVEGEDYSPVLGNRVGGTTGKRRTEYHLTLDMAKELAMVENNEQGRKVRRYFIACEKALATPAVLPTPPKREIRSRADLSFTRHDEAGRIINWSVHRDTKANWNEGVAEGERFFDEIAELAEHSEWEAYNAVRFAISGAPEFQRGGGTHYRNTGRGEEDGFAERLARAVIDGLRARKAGCEPFDPREGGGKKRSTPALPKPKRSALPCLTAPAQLSMALH